VRWNFQYAFNCRFTKESSSENFVYRLRFEIIMVIIVCGPVFGPPFIFLPESIVFGLSVRLCVRSCIYTRACRRFLVTSYCDECVCLSVFPFACLENYMSRLNQIFCAFYLWTWLGPSFDTLFYRATWVSRYQKGKTSLDLNKARDDGVWDGSGISWTTCKQSAPRSGQISLKANSYRTK